MAISHHTSELAGWAKAQLRPKNLPWRKSGYSGRLTEKLRILDQVLIKFDVMFE